MTAPSYHISHETSVTPVFIQTSRSSQQIFRWHKRSHRLDFHLPSASAQSHEKLAANTDRQETVLSQEQPFSCQQTESRGHEASWQTKFCYSAVGNKKRCTLQDKLKYAANRSQRPGIVLANPPTSACVDCRSVSSYGRSGILRSLCS